MHKLIETAADAILSVSQLNRKVKNLLDEEFGFIQVEGEISNLSAPASGHCYFSLKDANAQVRCALFKMQASRTNCKLANGMKVLVQAQVSLYEPRGDYQLIIYAVEEAGLGLLRQKFEQLKQQLYQEGLFDARHKKTLPQLPERIGLITSPSGAAVHDILSVLKRRFPAIEVIIYPSSVQGDSAKFELVKALELANQRNECDVLILSRGGGSLEDLWPFNEEMVARALFASKIPIISGVGHEIDTTIADFVADARAATPSAAAELAAPDQNAWLIQFRQIETQLQSRMQQKLITLKQSLNWQSQRLNQRHPWQILRKNAQQLDFIEKRLLELIQLRIDKARQLVVQKDSRLWRYNPATRVANLKQRLAHCEHRLQTLSQSILERKRAQWLTLNQTLHALSPLATLERGYAIVFSADRQNVIRQTQQVKPGDTLQTRLAQGQLISIVKEILP